MGGKMGEKGEIRCQRAFLAFLFGSANGGDPASGPMTGKQWLLESLNPGCRIPKHTLNKATLVFDGR